MKSMIQVPDWCFSQSEGSLYLSLGAHGVKEDELLADCGPHMYTVECKGPNITLNQRRLYWPSHPQGDLLIASDLRVWELNILEEQWATWEYNILEEQWTTWE